MPATTVNSELKIHVVGCDDTNHNEKVCAKLAEITLDTDNKSNDRDSGREISSSSSLSSTSNDDDMDEFVDAEDTTVAVARPATEPAERKKLNTDDNEQFDNLPESCPAGCSGSLSSSLSSEEAGEETVKEKQQAEGEEDARLRASITSTISILSMALNNEFEKALLLCEPKAKKDLYAALAHATLSFLRAALTLERGDLQVAIEAINNSNEVSARKRKSTMSRLWWRPNYNNFTDEQIHAELVHAESLLMMAMITFLADQSLICLVKGAFRIRSCYQTYKECMHILLHRKAWSSPLARQHFESGVRMGLGTFNLFMSYMPTRVLRFLEYVGFSGDRVVGVTELDRSVGLNDGLRSVFSALIILTYHSYMEPLFGLGHFDADKVRTINDALMVHYPISAFFLLFRGRYHQITGNLSEAIKCYDMCEQSQNDWKQFHSICHWEMMWCYAVQQQWHQAAHYSLLLCEKSMWSPASYTYQYATFLYASLVDRKLADHQLTDSKQSSKEIKQEYDKILKLMQTVPTLRIRYAGKTLPAEKFAITRASQYCAQAEQLNLGTQVDNQELLTLPAVEFFYIWNIFASLNHNTVAVEALVKRIDSELRRRSYPLEPLTLDDIQDIEHYLTRDNEKKKNSNNNTETPVDDYALMVLLKALCLKNLSRYNEALAYLHCVLRCESYIKNDSFLMPHAKMEMGLIYIRQAQYVEARQWLTRAKHEHTGYLMETLVHFRIHAANQVISRNQSRAIEDDSIEGEIIEDDSIDQEEQCKSSSHS